MAFFPGELDILVIVSFNALLGIFVELLAFITFFDGSWFQNASLLTRIKHEDLTVNALLRAHVFAPDAASFDAGFFLSSHFVDFNDGL